MKSTSQMINTLLSVLFLAYSCVTPSLAAPSHHNRPGALFRRVVARPKIISPNRETIWRKGELQIVTWETADLPKDISNSFHLRLRSHDRELPVSLAEDFDPRGGFVAITVPSLVVGNYSIVLYGDSGNWSDEFEILGGPTS